MHAPDACHHNYKYKLHFMFACAALAFILYASQRAFSLSCSTPKCIQLPKCKPHHHLLPFKPHSSAHTSSVLSYPPFLAACRCGLLAEALQLVRAYAAAQKAAAARRTALQTLLAALFDWAVATQPQPQQQQQRQAHAHAAPAMEVGGHWASMALLELCFTEEVRGDALFRLFAQPTLLLACNFIVVYLLIYRGLLLRLLHSVCWDHKHPHVHPIILQQQHTHTHTHTCDCQPLSRCTLFSNSLKLIHRSGFCASRATSSCFPSFF